MLTNILLGLILLTLVFQVVLLLPIGWAGYKAYTMLQEFKNKQEQIMQLTPGELKALQGGSQGNPWGEGDIDDFLDQMEEKQEEWDISLHDLPGEEDDD